MGASYSGLYEEDEVKHINFPHSPSRCVLPRCEPETPNGLTTRGGQMVDRKRFTIKRPKRPGKPRP